MRNKSLVISIFTIVVAVSLAAMTSCSKPLKTSKESRKLGKEIITIEPGTWRSATVFTHVVWRDLLFYGAGSGSDGGDPRHEMEIGIFHLVKPDSGYHNKNNPVITRKQFGLDQPGKGITPLSIYDRGDSLFMFCTSRPDDDLQPHIVQISASVADPYSWGNYRTIIDNEVSGELNNHGASVLVDPDDEGQLLIYFAALTPPHEYRILLGQMPNDKISDPAAFKLLNDYEHAVLGREGGKTNYPFVRYDQKKKHYELWYSGHTIGNTATRSCYVTRSTVKDRFKPADEIFYEASGVSDRNDNAYATGPKVVGNSLYYSGRREGKGDYQAIFYLDLSDLK